MKIGIYLDDYVPEDGGGFTLQSEIFDALCNLVPNSTHEFIVLSTQSKKLQSKVSGFSLKLVDTSLGQIWDRTLGFFVRTWPSLRSRLRWQSSLERTARRAGVEFIWFLSPRHPDVDLPYMTIVLDLQHRLQPWFPEVSQFGEWENREKHYAVRLRRAAAIITGTSAGRSEIERFYQVPSERIHILPHPTPSYALGSKPAAEEEILVRFNLKRGYLFYPAQFWPHKNHITLLRAIKLLKDKGEQHQLVLTGADFGNKGYIRENVKTLGLEDEIKFLGFVKRTDMTALYRNALALTYVSFFGPENLPPLEAFALGCPVIAAKVSGSKEQCGDAAILVDPASPNEIADAIYGLADKQLRDTLIAKGRVRASRWTAEDFVRGSLSILDSFGPIRSNWN